MRTIIATDQLRPSASRGFTRTAPGSVLIQAGRTTVLCTASVDNKVPAVDGRQGARLGHRRIRHAARQHQPAQEAATCGKVDGRTTEIQRLIGRSLRAVIDLEALGERTDHARLRRAGSRRRHAHRQHHRRLGRPGRCAGDARSTASSSRFADSVAAVSVGIVEGRPLLDLDYREDVDAEVDMNVVMTGSGQFVEVQGTGEEATFSEAQLTELLALARRGIQRLSALQKESLGGRWPG